MHYELHLTFGAMCVRSETTAKATEVEIEIEIPQGRIT